MGDSLSLREDTIALKIGISRPVIFPSVGTQTNEPIDQSSLEMVISGRKIRLDALGVMRGR